MAKILKVAFAGASGTGKTTVATAVADKLGIEFCNIGSREVAKQMGFNSPYDVDTFGKRTEFQHTLLNVKSEWEDKHDCSFITDRTHFDNLVYSIMHDCVRTVSPEFMDEIVHQNEKYTHIFFFPLDSFIDVNNDIARVSEINYHRIYERMLRLFLDKHCKSYVELKSISPEARVEEVLTCLLK